ncbi:LysR family transcriptional regulator [Vibrio superstes]|uniref:LysR family transcriptional regulator n=1 Tax=Vibrio superstes NBRC 103154 TaxID=1219062 RepID=A0A511QN73_9VIBR|nr:LysR family transcriptional regulator [Vibrio superstes]GEM78778.1 LysR family transcriptional regulator [Vibrio superstes NBRC 103154]
MDIKTLKTFLSVAKLKNFSAAARELNTVQPTVSRHISDLENELGTKLFLRTTHQVELTAAGEVLLPEALAIIANDKRVKALVGKALESKESVLNIGYLATACSFFLPKILGEFSSSNAKVTTNLFEMTAQEQQDGLVENKIDIAFSRRQPQLDGSVFNVEKIYTDKLVAILPANHPLANNTEVSLTELRSEKFILFRRSEWSEMFEHISLLCQERGFSLDVSFHPENMRHLVTSVSSGLGISIAPQCIKFIADKNCVCIPIKEISLVLPLYIYYKKKGMSEPLGHLVNNCVSHAQDIQRMLTAS